jgi:hypothetical protein
MRSSALLSPQQPSQQPSLQIEVELSLGEPELQAHRDIGEDLAQSVGGTVANPLGDRTDSCKHASTPEMSVQVNIEAPHDFLPRPTTGEDSEAVGRADPPASLGPITVDRALIQVFLRSVLVPRDFLQIHARNSARAFKNCSAGSALFSR